MLLKDNKTMNSTSMKTLSNPIKSPTYMPPIKGIERGGKPFFTQSPNNNATQNPGSLKRITGVPPNNSPRKEYSQSRLKVISQSPQHPQHIIPLPKQPTSYKLQNPVEFDPPYGPGKVYEKGKSLSMQVNTRKVSKNSNQPTPRDQRHGDQDRNSYGTNSNDHTPNVGTLTRQQQDPSNTFEIFMTRLTRLQTRNLLPNYEPTRHSEKSHGLIKGFAVCTNQGLVRNYNEDRVSIVLNVLRPANKDPSEYWPSVNIFGVFDGHGGAKCAEFLRNNLHHHIVKNQNFPWNPNEALKEAFEEADKVFLEQAMYDGDDGKHDRSGSCGLVVMVVDDTCYLCNLGDSRAVMSQNSGNSRLALTRDHKPSDKFEQKRIVDAGGKIYQNFPLGPNGKRLDLDPKMNPFKVTIPFRILPGRLSVSRAFGDIEAKHPKFGGNAGVLISKPEITTLKINKDHDFIVLGSDGIYDKLSNDEILQKVWDATRLREARSVHEILKHSAENIIKESLIQKSLDNVTCIVIAFNNVESKVYNTAHETIDPRPASKKESRQNSTHGENPKLFSTYNYSQQQQQQQGAFNAGLSNGHTNKGSNNQTPTLTSHHQSHHSLGGGANGLSNGHNSHHAHDQQQQSGPGASYYNHSMNGNGASSGSQYGVEHRLKTPLKTHSSKDITNHRNNLSNGHLGNSNNISGNSNLGKTGSYTPHIGSGSNGNGISSSIDFMKQGDKERRMNSGSMSLPKIQQYKSPRTQNGGGTMKYQ